MDDLADFVRSPFRAEGAVRDVFRQGDGPPVIVIHEVPGISAEVARFARKLVAAGFTVFMPHLFGVLGKRTNELSRVRELAKLCISREWRVLAENRSSPIADWLRALARHVNAETGGRGVGVVGMCVTGNFALTMTLDDAVVAPVLAHPSFPLPISRRKAAALHVTPQTLDNARRRAREEGLKVLGVRFTSDVLFCRSARFQSLKRELGDAFEAVEVSGKSARPHPEPPHSVLTVGLIDREGEPTRAAVDRVISFLSERLR